MLVPLTSPTTVRTTFPTTFVAPPAETLSSSNRRVLSQHPNALLTLGYRREKVMPVPCKAIRGDKSGTTCTLCWHQPLSRAVVERRSSLGLFWLWPPGHALVLPPEAVTCPSSPCRTLHNSLPQILQPSLSWDEMLEKTFASPFRKSLKIKNVQEILTFSTLSVPTFLVWFFWVVFGVVFHWKLRAATLTYQAVRPVPLRY